MKVMTKRAISLLLTVAMFASLLTFSAFAEDGQMTENSLITEEESVEEQPSEPMQENIEQETIDEEEIALSLSVNPYGGAQDDIDTVSWYETDGVYYLFMPADVKADKLTVYFEPECEVTVNGEAIVSGQKTDVFAECGSYTVACGGKEYPVVVMMSENIPTIYIETESGSLDYIHENKDNKEAATIRVYEDGKQKLDSTLAHIKGRGNATWVDYDKKPYNIKFEEKTKLLGMDKAKKWTLLASASDVSIVRNPLAWYVGDKLGIDFGSDYRIVDLYINGDYMGNYIVCESVEIGKNRVNIFDLAGATEDVNSEELDTYSTGGTGINGSVPPWGTVSSAKWVNIPNDPEDISGGYLLECELSDRYVYETSGFTTSRNQNVVVKEPEYASKAQVEYISKYWQEAEDAIWSETGYNELGKHYSDYFDMASLVNMYIMFEYSVNGDGGKTSTYFYKDQGGKLVAAPLWDFDHSFDDSWNLWVTNKQSYNSDTNFALGDFPTIFNRLYRHEDFRKAVYARWAEVKDAIAGSDAIAFVNGLADEIEASAVMNGVRWKVLSTAEEYRSRVAVATYFIPERRYWLDIGFSENSATVCYDLNGGTGNYKDSIIHKNGETTIVLSPYEAGENDRIAIAPAVGLIFMGWNTKADGTGKTYQPGETITLNGYTVLYAQWKDPLLINARYGEKVKSVVQKVTPVINVIADTAFRLNKKYSISNKLNTLFAK